MRFAVVVGACGCADAATAPRPHGATPPESKPAVPTRDSLVLDPRVVTDSGQYRVAKVTGDSNKFQITAVPGATLPVVGTRFVSPAIGQAKVITVAETSGSSVTATTRPAEIQEVIQKGTISFDVPLELVEGDASTIPLTLGNGVAPTINIKNAASSMGIGKNGITFAGALIKEGQFCSGKASPGACGKISATLEGTLGVEPHAKCIQKLDFITAPYLSCVVTVKMTGGLGLTTALAGSAKGEWEQKFRTKSVPVASVSGVPVMYTNGEVVLKLSLQAEADTKVSMGFDAQMNYMASAIYNGASDGFDAQNSGHPTFTPRPVTFSSTASGSARVSIGLGVQVSGLPDWIEDKTSVQLGTSVFVEPYYDLAFGPASSPGLVKADATVGLDALLSYSASFWKLKNEHTKTWPLATENVGTWTIGTLFPPATPSVPAPPNPAPPASPPPPTTTPPPTGTTPPPPPPSLTAPRGLTATARSTTAVDVGWQNTSGTAASERVERKTGPAGTWAEVASLPGSTTTYSDAGLAPNTIYVYRVRSCATSACSPYSAEAQATTPPAVGAPSVTTSDATFVNPTSAILVGTVAANHADATAHFEWSTSNAMTNAQSTTTANVGAESGLVTVQATVNGLVPSTTYYFKLVATNGTGTGAGSVRSFTTGIAPLTPPAAPSNLAAMGQTGSSVSLTWADNANNEDRFEIQLRPATSSSWTQAATLGANYTLALIDGLTAGTTYVFHVRACNASGCSAYSNEAQAAPKLPRPVITTIDPSSPTASNQNVAITVNGQDFQQGLTVTAFFPNGGSTELRPPGQVLSPVIPTNFRLMITLGTPGRWQLRVNNPDGQQSDPISVTVR